MKRIVVAIDGSDPSVRAARRAAELARKLEMGLTFVHVVPSHAILNEWQVGGTERDLRELRCKEGLGMLSRVAKEVGVEPQLQCVEGTPAEAIEKLSHAEDVEMLVVGSRGRTLLGGMLIGSVAHRLVHLSRKAILVVH
jgi:nucleotide-binding universal stress UspA family protein